MRGAKLTNGGPFCVPGVWAISGTGVFKIGPGMHDALYRAGDEWESVDREKR